MSATTAIQLHGGVAYAGYIGANQNRYVFYSPALFEPGYTHTQISLGACTERPPERPPVWPRHRP